MVFKEFSFSILNAESQYIVRPHPCATAENRLPASEIFMTDNGHYIKRKFLANMLKCPQICTQETGRRMRDEGLGEFYPLRESQVPYNSDFAPENSGLSAENAYLGRDNP